ncbi:T6SS phospholipase effector Tle1-like catalytic domain-containing protein [Comamonas composti]|uniref:T6SS phospholipase effector Tle1-like catalytic domain-containing protein n=1 Tax=Comamonas composti TaxID=408558 RepID=UPI000420C3CB|nr:DUF2235 domain-containing protein [Comamonas composti]
MSQAITAEIQAKCPAPLANARASECEVTLNIGIFFDGTDNNKTENLKLLAKSDLDTNIVRLWQAYKDDPEQGSYSYYVSGVGTPLSELDAEPGTPDAVGSQGKPIPERRAERGGGAFGNGGETRILYGLLQVFNSVHAFINAQEKKFKKAHLNVLCSDTRVPFFNNSYDTGYAALTDDMRLLEQLGLPSGLDGIGLSGRKKFFGEMARGLKIQLKTNKPKIVGIYLDVFGFSRGATQARVFVNWLYQLMMEGDTLFGVPAYVRMLGLFDTVATVGESVIFKSHGHNQWAQIEDLRIPVQIKNCYHIIALHELRENFSVDSVAVNGSMPSNCQEVYCPGAHSDIGGGYIPGEQGKVVKPEKIAKDAAITLAPIRDDGYKLSHLPLNQMLAAAKKSCEGHASSPWLSFELKEVITQKIPQRFGVSMLPMIRAAVEEYFMLTQGSKAKAGSNSLLDISNALKLHSLQYLAWRYAVNQANQFEKLRSVQYNKALANESSGKISKIEENKALVETAKPEEEKEKISQEKAQLLRNVAEAQVEEKDKSTDYGLGYYLKGEEIFSSQISWLSQTDHISSDPYEMNRGAHPMAKQILAQMKTTRVDEKVAEFFDSWVHDSYAGFIEKFKDFMMASTLHSSGELQRYVRWRGLYAGSNEKLHEKPTIDGK